MKRFLEKIVTVGIGVFVTCCVSGHPMPHSVLQLDFRNDRIVAQLGIPLKEFQLVFPDEDIERNPATLIQRKGPWLDAYLLHHMRITDNSGKNWKIRIVRKSVVEDEQLLTGKFHELDYFLVLFPPAGVSPRHFTMYYDAVMHQLVTHKLFINISRDWYGGLSERDSVSADLGILSVNPLSGKPQPVEIDLDEGSTWKGFSALFRLGVSHINEGADHVLFLILLLLPAGLVVRSGKWRETVSLKKAFRRVAGIATAFTIGHALSLIAGSLHWLVLPQAVVEIGVALTIILTAVNVVRPIFFRYEFVVALLFGCVHGLAFAEVLTTMNIDGDRLFYSILGFNIGIELMQLGIIVCTLPWLLALSGFTLYKWVRILAAAFAMVDATGWIIAALKNAPNAVSVISDSLLVQQKWLLAALMLFTIGVLVWSRFAMRQKV